LKIAVSEARWRSKDLLSLIVSGRNSPLFTNRDYILTVLVLFLFEKEIGRRTLDDNLSGAKFSEFKGQTFARLPFPKSLGKRLPS